MFTVERAMYDILGHILPYIVTAFSIKYIKEYVAAHIDRKTVIISVLSKLSIGSRAYIVRRIKLISRSAKCDKIIFNFSLKVSGIV